MVYFNTLQKEYNNFGLLTYVEWDIDKKYHKSNNNMTPDERKKENCLYTSKKY